MCLLSCLGDRASDCAKSLFPAHPARRRSAGFLSLGPCRPGDKDLSGSCLFGRLAQGTLTGGEGRREVRSGREYSQ